MPDHSRRYHAITHGSPLRIPCGMPTLGDVDDHGARRVVGAPA